MTTEEIADTFGKVAYDKFMETQDHLTEFGTPAPPWEELEEGLRVGWRAGAVEVVKFHEFACMEQIKAQGFAGILEGRIVDRRIHRMAVPLPKNEVTGVPSPRTLPH